MKGKVWASGKITSDASINVKYEGPALHSTQKYFWRVRVWDNHRKSSPWSSTGSWQMGLLQPNDWTAKWIESDIKGAQPSYFRKDLQLKKQIASATAFVSARGLYTVFINGQRVGNDYLTPGWTSYKHRFQYQAYDVTGLLKSGANTLGAILAQGWYSGRLTWKPGNAPFGDKTALLMQVLICYTDGSQEYVLTESSWKYSTGDITFTGIYDGETVDARKAQNGWCTSGFNAQNWQAAKIVNYPFTNLVATQNECVQKHELIKPIQLITTPKGEKVIDLGQNAVGWEVVKLKGNAGDTVRIFHAEVLDKAGNFYTENLRSAKATSTYILKGGAEEIFEPKFTFYGCRYLKVEGVRGELNADSFRFAVAHSAMPKNGTFTSSNDLINKLQQNIQWGQRGNFVDVPTDCPQRDERLGWTGDAQAFFRTASFNYNVQPFFTKWLKDLAYDQNKDGAVPNVSPDVLSTDKRYAGGVSGWGDVATIIPWQLYRAYGDLRLLETQYPSMKAWVSYLEKNSKGNIRSIKENEQYGDWLFYSLDNDNSGKSAITDKNMIAQCFYAHATQLLVNAAEALGYTQDVAYYSTLLKKIKDAYLSEYMTPNGQLVSNTQTAYVLALQFDMLPEAKRDQAVKRLVKNIELYKTHLTTGFLGTPYLCHVLSRFGQENTAYKLLLQKTYPSWLYPVTQGATTIWERWNGQKPDSTFQYASMNSFNHYAYGAIGDWLYREGAGLSEDAPGFKKLIIRPTFNKDFNQMQAEQYTPYGKASSAWDSRNGWTLRVEIPVNTTATVYIPTKDVKSITESGKPLSEHPEITVNNSDVPKGTATTFRDKDCTRLAVGSGTYVFGFNPAKTGSAE
jgi:alpha-L-rhamnosidase